MLFISYITALLLLSLFFEQMYRTVINRHRPQRQANMWLVIFPLHLSNVIFLNVIMEMVMWTFLKKIWKFNSPFLTFYFLSPCYISISSYYLKVKEYLRMKVAGNKTNIVAIRPGILNEKLLQRGISPIKRLSRAVGAHKLGTSSYFLIVIFYNNNIII